MAVGASPSTHPPRGVPGKAAHFGGGHSLHFLLAAYGVGGARGHRAAVPSFLSPGTFSGTAVLSSVLARGSAGRPVAGLNRPAPPSLSLFPFWRRPGRPLLVLPGHGVESRRSFARKAAGGRPGATSTMSGSAGRGVGGVDGATASEAPRETTTAGGAASSPEAGGAKAGGEAGGGGGGGGGEFPAVTLDADAVQKFAEIEVRWGGDQASEPTVLIRGLKSAEYHVEAAEPTMVRLRESGHDATITGGGRIKHSSKGPSIFIYGYSMQFGPANLPRVADLCREQFGPDYEVTWTEGGY